MRTAGMWVAQQLSKEQLMLYYHEPGSCLRFTLSSTKRFQQAAESAAKEDSFSFPGDTWPEKPCVLVAQINSKHVATCLILHCMTIAHQQKIDNMIAIS